MWGYGKFSVDGKIVLAHRSSWELYNGGIPDGLLVLHKCDNPECSNPDHLFLGTCSDNSIDMSNKGRSTHGIKNTQAKLNPDEVLEIIRRLELGDSQQSIADNFNISQTSISSIEHGKTWRRITGRGVFK